MLAYYHPMHDRLVNWAAWVRDRRRLGHCMSIEYRYVPERTPDMDLRRDEQTRLSIDRLDAALIERTVCALTFPRRARTVLIHAYIHRSIPAVIARKSGVRYRDVEEAIKNACNIVFNRLKD